MRKNKYYLFLLLFLGVQSILAQKHDYMWPLGLGPGWGDYNFFLDFNGFDSPRMVIRSDTMSTGTYAASYCSADGQILVYSNGLNILNKDGIVVENSQSLNPTITLPEWNNKSYPGGDSGFFLGKPDNPNIVYFISLDFGPHPAQEWPYLFVGQNLMVATIDITANNGDGKVLEKNKILLSGTLMSPAACRHANGRDWWIMVSNADENRHYRILLDPEGFSTPLTQLIGTKPSPIGGNKSCQSVGNCFSLKGQYYVDINDLLGFSIFEFDRCSGELSNERRVDYPPPSPSYPTFYRNSSGRGAVFSENEQFFYKTTTYHAISSPWIPGTKPYLFQFDLEAGNLAASIDTINLIDSAEFHFPTNITLEKFLGAELGPDGRIYVVHKGNSYCTVQYPNLKGRACKFIHDKPYFGVVISEAIPYMPNYRLGPLDGSQCDTLGLNNIPVANFRVDDSLGFFTRYFYDRSHHEPTSWHWDFGDGSMSTEQSPLYEYDSAGIYQVCLTVSNQYGSDMYCRTLYLGVSTTDSPGEKEQVSVSPNPFSQRLTVFNNTMLHNSVFLLYDAMGSLIHRERIDNRVNEIQVKDLNNGMYFWKIVSNGKLVRAGKIIRADK